MLMHALKKSRQSVRDYSIIGLLCMHSAKYGTWTWRWHTFNEGSCCDMGYINFTDNWCIYSVRRRPSIFPLYWALYVTLHTYLKGTYIKPGQVALSSPHRPIRNHILINQILFPGPRRRIYGNYFSTCGRISLMRGVTKAPLHYGGG